MNIRIAGIVLKTVALTGLLAGTAAVSGCTALGSRAFADRTTTSSVSASAIGSPNQAMPKPLGATQVAAGPFIPPSDIGGSGVASALVPVASGQGPTMGSVSTTDLPVLTSSTSQGNATPMSAQPSFAPVAAASTPMSVPTAAPSLVSVPSDAYVHVIESGESLYTIARRYDVTAQAIVQANGFGSPDKIYVGQKIVIPGRPDLLVKKGPATSAAAPVLVASANPAAAMPAASPEPMQAETPVAAAAPAAKPLVQPAVEPKLSGADKFRWPVSGRVITDFANSKGTGINIEAPEGAAIRAAENGQVIYVGSGVEGYGNLVLIRHPNGYVSAYAHLKDTAVNKGDVVNRGDNIGSAGMTGSVSRPQLHFELRKGATPVDPVPLLAS